VPQPLRGRGYGYHLVRGALDLARQINLKVVRMFLSTGGT
jgi:hypothetical protein